MAISNDAALDQTPDNSHPTLTWRQAEFSVDTAAILLPFELVFSPNQARNDEQQIEAT